MFKKGDRISHLFFGTGCVGRVRSDYYEIKFENGEKKNILKGHSVLREHGFDWSEKQVREAQEYVDAENRKVDGDKHLWRAYPSMA